VVGYSGSPFGYPEEVIEAEPFGEHGRSHPDHVALDDLLYHRIAFIASEKPEVLVTQQCHHIIAPEGENTVADPC